MTEPAASIDNLSPITQLLIEWRQTDEVPRRPELHALQWVPRPTGWLSQPNAR